MRQKTCIIACYQVAAGDKERTVQLYASLDAAGLVQRESNVRPLDGRQYGHILFHSAKKLGWFNHASN